MASVCMSPLLPSSLARCCSPTDRHWNRPCCTLQVISYIRSTAQAHTLNNVGSNPGAISSTGSTTCLAGTAGLARLASGYADNEYTRITIPFSFNFQGKQQPLPNCQSSLCYRLVYI